MHHITVGASLKIIVILKCICPHSFNKLFNSRLRNLMLYRDEELNLPYLL